MHHGKSFIAIFQEFFDNSNEIFILTGRLRTNAIILLNLETFLIFSNFLRSSVLNRSVTREETDTYHVYK